MIWTNWFPNDWDLPARLLKCESRYLMTDDQWYQWLFLCFAISRRWYWSVFGSMNHLRIMRTTQIPEPVPFYPRVTRVGSPFSSQIAPRPAVGFLTAAPRASSTLTTAPFLSDTQPKKYGFNGENHGFPSSSAKSRWNPRLGSFWSLLATTFRRHEFRGREPNKLAIRNLAR